MDIAEILKAYKTIAFAGLSEEQDSESYKTALYMKSSGYKIIPVNKTAYEILDERSCGSLDDVKEAEIVAIFGPAEDIGQIVEQAIRKKAKVVWMHLGLKDEHAAEKARQAGLEVIMDKSMMVEHKRFQELALIERTKTFILPILTEQENSPEFLERLKECTKLVMLFVVDKTVLNHVPVAFSGARINSAQQVMEDIKKSLPQNILVKDFVEWGDWYEKIENLARLENADEVIMKHSRMSDEFSAKLREKGLTVRII